VRVGALIAHGSELSWAVEAPPVPPAPPDAARVRTVAARALTTLARQLTTREGNLHLTAAGAVSEIPP
jgi:hypothetical protein